MDKVLNHQHKVDGAELVVKPYFDFLQRKENVKDSGTQNQDMVEHLSDSRMQASPPTGASDNGQSAPQMVSEPPSAGEEVEEEEAMEDQTVDEVQLSRHFAVADSVKLALFQLTPLKQNIERAHSNFNLRIQDGGVHIEGDNGDILEQIEHTIVDFFANIAETDFTLEPEKLQFLTRTDVKNRLLQTINQTGSPTVYSVSDSKVMVKSVSQNSAKQACSILKSQLCIFTVPLDVECEGILYCREWSEFVQALSFTSVKVSERGGNVDVVTLKEMESEKQAAILKFLTTPIEREAVISMEPGRLKYMQIHCHQLLADMDQVSIFPLEAEDACGLKVCGIISFLVRMLC